MAKSTTKFYIICFAIIFVIITAFAFIITASTYNENKIFQKELALAIKRDDTVDMQLVKKYSDAVEAAGIKIIEKGYIDYNCDGKYPTKYVFISADGIEYVPITASSMRADTIEFDLENWTFVVI